jgi:uncharacterized protein YqeY
MGKNLKEEIEKDFLSALKEKNLEKVNVLRLLKNEIHKKEIDKKGNLTDEEIREIILKEIKKRKEAISLYEKGERQDLAEKEKKEIEILKKYLPEMLTEEEIEKMAKEVIKKLKVKDVKEMGRVMGELMKKLKGKADGEVIAKIVKKLIS